MSGSCYQNNVNLSFILLLAYILIISMIQIVIACKNEKKIIFDNNI